MFVIFEEPITHDPDGQKSLSIKFALVFVTDDPQIFIVKGTLTDTQLEFAINENSK